MASTRVLSGLPPIFVYKTDAWVSLCDGGICEGVEFGLACLANSRVMLRGITIIYQPHVRLLQIGRKRCLFANEAADEAMGNKSVDGDSCVGDVYSNDGQANLDRSNGNANDDNGVGLSVRLKEELAPPFLLID